MYLCYLYLHTDGFRSGRGAVENTHNKCVIEGPSTSKVLHSRWSRSVQKRRHFAERHVIDLRQVFGRCASEDPTAPAPTYEADDQSFFLFLYPYAGSSLQLGKAPYRKPERHPRGDRIVSDDLRMVPQSQPALCASVKGILGTQVGRISPPRP